MSRMTKIIIMLTAVLSLSYSSIAEAQPCNACGDNLIHGFSSATAIKASDWTSYATVASNIGIDTYHSWTSSNRRLAFEKQALRTGLTIGVSEIAKRLVKQERPDRSDNLSFWSEHTSLSFSSIRGASLKFTLPLSIITGAGRIGAKKHYLVSDVVTGTIVGILTDRIR